MYARLFKRFGKTANGNSQLSGKAHAELMSSCVMIVLSIDEVLLDLDTRFVREVAL